MPVVGLKMNDRKNIQSFAILVTSEHVTILTNFPFALRCIANRGKNICGPVQTSFRNEHTFKRNI